LSREARDLGSRNKIGLQQILNFFEIKSWVDLKDRLAHGTIQFMM